MSRPRSEVPGSESRGSESDGLHPREAMASILTDQEITRMGVQHLDHDDSPKHGVFQEAPLRVRFCVSLIKPR